MAFIKLSILKIYGEIFISRRFHICLWIVASFMLVWAVSFSLAAIFQCTPIAYNWNTGISGGHCINYGVVVIAAGALNIITDFTLLLIPIPLVWRLHTSKQKKWQIILTFALGSRYVIYSLQICKLPIVKECVSQILMTTQTPQCLYCEHCATCLRRESRNHC